MGTIVSTGLTLTLLAGLATGFVYLLIAGLKWARDQHHKSRIWLFKELKSKFQSTVAGIHKSGRSEEDVRDAIEKLSEKLIGGSLDEVQISKISLHPTYVELCWKYEGALSLVLSRLTASLQLLADDLSSGVPGTPEKIIYQLKSLIAEITSGAHSLPILQKVHFINNLNDLAAKSYEDILAIAIINKIIITQQSALLSSLQSNKSIDLFLSKAENDNNYDSDSNFDFDEVEVDETSSVSTDPFSTKMLHEPQENGLPQEEWDNLDESEKQDLLAVKFLFNSRTTFPEFGVDIIDADAAVKTSYEKNTNVDTWEDNWLFKKRKLKESIKTSVSMLIPSPNEPVKAFIGNEDAEETSDLSDYSESELEDLLNFKEEDNSPSTRADSDIISQSPKSSNTNLRRRGSGDSESGIFEESVLKGSLTNIALRSRDGSQQFTINPLFMDDSCYTPCDDRPRPHYTSLQHPNKNRQKITLISQPSLIRTTLDSLKTLRKTETLS